MPAVKKEKNNSSPQLSTRVKPPKKMKKPKNLSIQYTTETQFSGLSDEVKELFKS